MLNNQYRYVKTVVDVESLLDISERLFVVNEDNAVTPVYEYDEARAESTDKIIGVNLDIRIVEDVTDYGIDKKSGKPRKSNKHQILTIKVLNPKLLDAELKEDQPIFISTKPENIVKTSIFGDSFSGKLYITVNNINSISKDKFDELKTKMKQK